MMMKEVTKNETHHLIVINYKRFVHMDFGFQQHFLMSHIISMNKPKEKQKLKNTR